MTKDRLYKYFCKHSRYYRGCGGFYKLTYRGKELYGDTPDELYNELEAYVENDCY